MKLNQEGFNLLELMLALLIVASVLLFAGHYYQVTKENTRVSEAARLVNQILEASFKYLEAKSAYQVDTNLLPLLADMDLLPKHFKNDSRLSPWLSSVSMVYRKASGQNSNYLELIMDDIPSKACVQLMNLMNRYSGASRPQGGAAGNFSCSSQGDELNQRFQGKFETAGVT